MVGRLCAAGFRGGSRCALLFCYRDELTVANQRTRPTRLCLRWRIYRRTGAQLAPHQHSIPTRWLTQPAVLMREAAWVMLPEYVLHGLCGRRVGEFTNASHTGLVSLETGTWDTELFEKLGLALEAAPPIVPTGTIVGKLRGALESLGAFSHTDLIAAPATTRHPPLLEFRRSVGTLYICSGTWSLVGDRGRETGDDARSTGRKVHQHWRAGRRDSASTRAPNDPLAAEAVARMPGAPKRRRLPDRGSDCRGCTVGVSGND